MSDAKDEPQPGDVVMPGAFDHLDGQEVPVLTEPGGRRLGTGRLVVDGEGVRIEVTVEDEQLDAEMFGQSGMSFRLPGQL